MNRGEKRKENFGISNLSKQSRNVRRTAESKNGDQTESVQRTQTHMEVEERQNQVQQIQ